jgi:hypothetical protein
MVVVDALKLPVTFPVTFPVKGPENAVAVTVPETFSLPDTVSFPVMANVPPDGVMLLMIEDTDGAVGENAFNPVVVLSPTKISPVLLDIYITNDFSEMIGA